MIKYEKLKTRGNIDSTFPILSERLKRQFINNKNIKTKQNAQIDTC